MPPRHGPPTGFVSVVVEQQPYGLLITLTVNPDIADPSNDRITKVAGIPAAITAITDVLTSWDRRLGDRPSVTPP